MEVIEEGKKFIIDDIVARLKEQGCISPEGDKQGKYRKVRAAEIKGIELTQVTRVYKARDIHRH